MIDKKAIKKFLGVVVRYLVASVSLSVILYVLLALFFSTADERRLEKENKLYRERFNAMKSKATLIGDVLEGLKDKDDAIYQGLFKTPAPSLEAITAPDIIPGKESLSLEKLMGKARGVDNNFEELFMALERRKDSIPPLTLPLHNISYVQAGASVGMKHSPVLKLSLMHEGIDLIASQGSPVYAAASGTVTKVTHSRKGLGNTVEIDHGNGFVTRYCLLGEVTAVQGRKVKRNQKIGNVGITASLGASHLHFEVLKNGEVKDPLDYFFLSLSPEEYARMRYIVSNTVQSMD